MCILPLYTSFALLIVRQTFIHRHKEIPAKCDLKRVDGGEGKPTDINCERVDDALKKTGLFVAGASLMFARWVKGFKAHPNQLPLFDQETSNKVGGDPKIRYYHSYWNLKDDECLVIVGRPPKCKHWNFQLNNYWMESLDARYFNTWVNIGTATYRDDGSVRVVVSHKDPEDIVTDKSLKYDWINTCNHNEGHMLWRWIDVDPKDDGENLPSPVPTVVKYKDLANFLIN